MAGGTAGDEDFASLLAEYDRRGSGDGRARRRDPQLGETVQGRLLSVGQEQAFVDLGCKAEGMIETGELRDADGRLAFSVGDVIEARVVEVDGKAGCIVLRRTLGRGPDAAAELERAHQHRIPVEGVVSAVNKGGVEVQLAGMRAFCPISQLDLRHVEDAAQFIGQRLTFRITRFEQAGRGRGPNIVLSRRVLLEEEAAARAAETRARLAVGKVVCGRVTSLRSYGAFVDLGGLEGMLHISEVGFARVERLEERLAVGQEIEVEVIAIEKTADPRRPEKISLSLRALERDPWQDAGERFPEGARLRGTVARVEAFGAFVELLPGVQGLLHVSELAAGGGRRLRHPRELLRAGQPVEVTVLGIDLDRRRISLAMAAAAGDGDEDDGDSGGGGPGSGGGSLGTLGDLLRRKKQ
jgi:small subunit ribosomal protein S1